MSILKRKNPTRHQVLVMRFDEGLEISEIRDRLGITRQNCDQRLSRARKDLEKIYNGLVERHG
jgi:DNA-directed RNA polymerase specialized sigma24 family protein